MQTTSQTITREEDVSIQENSNVGVVFGGPTPEHDVSILTGLQVARELLAGGRAVVAIYWSKAGDWYTVASESEGKDFVDGLPSTADAIELHAYSGGGFVRPKKKMFAKPEAIDLSVVVNCCHGGPGEDGSLQGALDLAGIAYTGPGVTESALGMDKYAFGALVASLGYPVLPRAVLTTETTDVGFEGPYIIKPRFGGSSIGIEVVDNVETARSLVKSSPHLRSGAVIEPYRPNSFDLNVAVRTHPEPQLSAIEKPVRSNAGGEILGYADKYVGEEGMVSAPRELPAELPRTTEDSLRAMALGIARACGGRGVQRIDFLCDGVDIFVNEVNTIPGSLAKHLWVQPTVAFATLLEDMISEALTKRTRNWSTAGADGSALRSAGSIQGKLS